MKSTLVHFAKYRFFNNLEHAQDFASGRSIRISTLDACRKHESPKARDINEGKTSTFVSHIHIKNSINERELVQDLDYSGIKITGPSLDIKVVNSTGKNLMLKDSYVLCLSNMPNQYLIKHFGEYCVRINDPDKFYQALYNEMKKQFLTTKARFDHVKYDDSLTIDIAQNRIHKEIGFVKTNNYSPEDEIRMLFYSTKENIEPVFLTVPEVENYCEILIFSKKL